MKNLKKIISFALTAMLLISLCACAQQPSETGVEVPKGFTLAENEKTDYYFVFPSTWILDRNDAGMTSVFVSDNDFSNVSITPFTASAEYSSLADYAEHYYFKQFEDNFNNLEVEKNQDGSLKKTTMTIDDSEAIAISYTADFAGEAYAFRAWFISHNGYIYNVLYTAKEAYFDSHLSEAEAIAEHIQFR